MNIKPCVSNYEAGFPVKITRMSAPVCLHLQFTNSQGAYAGAYT